MWQWIKAVACALGIVAMPCVLAPPAHAAEDEARVLILNGVDPYLPAYLEIDGAMRASLAKETTKRIVLYSESLDSQRFAIEHLETEELALLAKKYRTPPIDVVVTVTRPAFDFFIRNGERLWPGARLVYHGLPDSETESVAVPPNATGLVNRDDFVGTINLARRLQPNARRILVISGVSPLDSELERRARQVLPNLAAAMSVEYISGSPPSESRKVEASGRVHYGLRRRSHAARSACRRLRRLSAEAVRRESADRIVGTREDAVNVTFSRTQHLTTWVGRNLKGNSA